MTERAKQQAAENDPAACICQEIAERSAGSGMDIKEAVTHKERYSDIVTYFRNQKTLSIDQLVLLIDTIDAMSPEIYEHYRALQDIFRRQIKDIAGRKEQAGGLGAVITPSEKDRFSYVITKGCANGTLLEEKYGDLTKQL